MRRVVLVLCLIALSGPLRAEEFWCEGLDDDLDGLIDETCSRTCDAPYRSGVEVPAALASAGTTAVSAARSGPGIAVAYSDPRSGVSQVFARVLALSGSPDHPETAIGNGIDAAYDPAIVWDGTGYGVVWVDERDGNPEIYFRKLTADGTPGPGAPAPIVVSSSAGASLRPVLTWTGSEYGIAWDDVKGSNRDVYFRRVSYLGAVVGQSARVTSDGSAQEQPSLAWDGTQFALAWADDRNGNREIYLRRLDASGVLLGVEVRVTTAIGVSDRPHVVPHGPGDFGVVWQDARSGNDDVYYGRWTGPTWSAPTNVAIASGPSAGRFPTLAATGVEAVVAWEDGRNGPTEAWARRISLAGTALSAEVQVTTAIESAKPRALWHGSGVVLAFLGTPPAGSTSVYVAHVGCGGNDADGDSFLVSTGDCNDLSTAQSPAVTESCDALDDDCDGAEDEMCRGTCRPEMLTYPAEVSPGPSAQSVPMMVLDGSGYAVAYEQGESSPEFGSRAAVWFMKLDDQGQPLGVPLRVSPAGRFGTRPWLVWNGTEYGLAWEQHTIEQPSIANVAFARIDSSGASVTSTREITKDPPFLTTGFRRPALVWTGAEYAVAFTEMEQNSQTGRVLRFARLDRDGNRRIVPGRSRTRRLGTRRS